MIYVLVSKCPSNRCGSGYCKSDKTELLFASPDKNLVELKLKEYNDLEDRFRAAYTEMKARQVAHKIPLYLTWLKVPNTQEFRDHMSTAEGDAFNNYPEIAAQNAEYAIMKRTRDEKFTEIANDVIKKYNLPEKSGLYGAQHTFSIYEVEST